jgi:3-oxoacyl-[acyl-carrier protein] reductase
MSGPSYPPSHGLLDGKRVLVTASAGVGIGFATARRCAEEGATVVLSDTHERRLEEAADEIEKVSGDRPAAIRCDVTNEDQVQNLFEDAGVLDVVVCNAGLGGTKNLVVMTDEEWHAVLDVTLT